MKDSTSSATSPWVISATSNLAGRFARGLAAASQGQSPATTEAILAALKDDAEWSAVKKRLKEAFDEEKRVNVPAKQRSCLTGRQCGTRGPSILGGRSVLSFASRVLHAEFRGSGEELGFGDYWDAMRISTWRMRARLARGRVPCAKRTFSPYWGLRTR